MSLTQSPQELEKQPISLDEWDAQLPAAPQPIGSYVTAVQVGNLLYTSGTLPMKEGKLIYSGAVGSVAVSLEDGQEAARLCALNCLGIVKSHLGSLNRIARVVKLTGFVNSAPAFYEQPAVINGASNFLVEVLGEKGKHARAAVGVASLPMNASVEIEMIIEVQ